LSLFVRDLLSRLEARARTKGYEAFCGLLAALLSQFVAQTGIKDQGLNIYSQPPPPSPYIFFLGGGRWRFMLVFFFFMCKGGD
jgi:hypothetical protein